MQIRTERGSDAASNLASSLLSKRDTQRRTRCTARELRAIIEAQALFVNNHAIFRTYRISAACLTVFISVKIDLLLLLYYIWAFLLAFSATPIILSSVHDDVRVWTRLSRGRAGAMERKRQSSPPPPLACDIGTNVATGMAFE